MIVYDSKCLSYDSGGYAKQYLNHLHWYYNSKTMCSCLAMPTFLESISGVLLARNTSNVARGMSRFDLDRRSIMMYVWASI